MSYFHTPPRVPTVEQVDACLAITDTDGTARDHLLVAMAAWTGLRAHELVALRWGQMVTEAGTVRRRVVLVAEDTKGSVGGDIILSERLRWKVQRYRRWCRHQGLGTGEDSPMFASRQRSQLSVRRLQQVWRGVQEQAGIDRPFHFHALRHFFGTQLYRKTCDIRLTQIAMRHRSVSSTQVYTHVSAKDVEMAVEAVF